MTLAEIKKALKEKKIDRRELAKKLGVSPQHLTNILNEWAPLKGEREKIIKAAIDEK